MMALCRSCEAPIIWTRTTRGELMPIDADPVPDGNVVLTGRQVESRTGGYVPESKVEAATITLFDDGATRYLSHFATCPHAGEWRRAPAQLHSVESRDAARRAEPGAARDRDRILTLLRLQGPLTDEQIADALGLSGNTERPRRRELEKANLVRKVGQGLTKAKRTAALWGAMPDREMARG